MLNPACLAGAGLLTSFKRQDSMKNVQLARRVCSADQEAAEEFLKCLVSIMQEKCYMRKSRFSMLMRLLVVQGCWQMNL